MTTRDENGWDEMSWTQIVCSNGPILTYSYDTQFAVSSAWIVMILHLASQWHTL